MRNSYRSFILRSSIRFLRFTYEKTYQAVPEPGGEKAFELLRKALMEEQKIAIGKTVFGTKDTLMAIIPREDGMLISTMFYEDDVKALPKNYTRPEVGEQELTMAKTLIDSMDTPFNPSDYKDEYQVKLKELIEKKSAEKRSSLQSRKNNRAMSLT